VAATQKLNFGKATSYLERWLANTTKPAYDQSRQEAAIFYAICSNNQAVIDQEKIDKTLLKRPRLKWKRGCGLYGARPKESFYLILLAISQQEGNYQRLADLLSFWSSNPQPRRIIGRSSHGVYLNLAAQEKERKRRRVNITRVHPLRSSDGHKASGS